MWWSWYEMNKWKPLSGTPYNGLLTRRTFSPFKVIFFGGLKYTFFSRQDFDCVYAWDTYLTYELKSGRHADDAVAGFRLALLIVGDLVGIFRAPRSLKCCPTNFDFAVEFLFTRLITLTHLVPYILWLFGTEDFLTTWNVFRFKLLCSWACFELIKCSSPFSSFIVYISEPDIVCVTFGLSLSFMQFA